jgi:hypothetical protein
MRRKWRCQPPGVTASVSSRSLLVLFSFSLLFIVLEGSPAFNDWHTAHARRAMDMCANRHLFLLCFRYISLGDDAFVLSLDSNK